jgi:cytidylate kinase
VAKYPVITIDGPAASGKSSVSRELAARLGWNWLSTGAFYRGLAYVAYKEGVSLEDEAALATLASANLWEVKMSAAQTLVFYRDEDVTLEIFKEKVGSSASILSQYPSVRAALLSGQRACADMPPGLVAEGRDCGTVVFPQAEMKFFLTASQEDRALRRAQECGDTVDQARARQQERDQRDQTRKTAPLAIPEDAEVIDTTGFSLQEVVDQVQEKIRSRGLI